MRKRNFLLLIVAFVCVLAACQKELSNEGGNLPTGGPLPTDSLPHAGDTSHNSANAVIGTWKFVNVQGTGSTTTEFSQSGLAIKAITSSSFTSENNGGTITFDSTTMTATGITLAINTTATTGFYTNNVFTDSLQTPLNQSVPPQDATSGYQKAGADSLYFQDGGLLDALTGGLLPSTPSGCKVSFAGNTMKMTIAVDTVTTQTYQGIPARITIHMVLVVTLQKN
jgi:hypothetical protein